MNSIRLRPAKPKDAQLVYRWRMDPETRKQSHNTGKFTKASHVKWFNQHLAELSMIEWDGKTVGQIRIHDGLVSIVVAPAYRGKGIATAALRKLGMVRTFKAEIKPDNWASIRAFRKAGFSVSFLTMTRH